MKHFTLLKKPLFKQGELVRVDFSKLGQKEELILTGKIVGKSSEHIIDCWLVQFDKPLHELNENFIYYRFDTMSTPHCAIIDETAV